MIGPVAITGATGFIGRRIAQRLIADGGEVRALCRRWDQALSSGGAVLVVGSLEDADSLKRLVSGASAVVHCAGAIRAPTRSAFERANRAGTASLLDAIRTARVRARFIMMSSLAAREPRLSPYAASKRMAEEEVAAGARDGIDPCIIRPPAVYGPGDRSTLPIFKQLQRGFLLVPPTAGARFSLLFVEDLAELVVRLLDAPSLAGAVVEPDDGRQGGYSWEDVATIAGGQLGRSVRTIALPRPLLWLGAAIEEARSAVWRRRSPILSFGKLRELLHRDWVCRSVSTQALAGWTARTTFETGFARTLAWYKESLWI
ncbi:MAG: NAD-dependent epimerase/dehydratase family protein [Geminicoccaceae bacterium]